MSRDRQIAVLASIVGLAGLIIGIVAISQVSGAEDDWVRNRALPGDSTATSAAAPASESDEREIRELSDRLERLEERQVAESQESTDDPSNETAEDRESASTDRDDSDLGAAQSAAPEEAEDRDGFVLEYDAEDPAGNEAEQVTLTLELDEEGEVGDEIADEVGGEIGDQAGAWASQEEVLDVGQRLPDDTSATQDGTLQSFSTDGVPAFIDHIELGVTISEIKFVLDYAQDSWIGLRALCNYSCRNYNDDPFNFHAGQWFAGAFSHSSLNPTASEISDVVLFETETISDKYLTYKLHCPNVVKIFDENSDNFPSITIKQNNKYSSYAYTSSSPRLPWPEFPLQESLPLEPWKLEVGDGDYTLLSRPWITSSQRVLAAMYEAIYHEAIADGSGLLGNVDVYFDGEVYRWLGWDYHMYDLVPNWLSEYGHVPMSGSELYVEALTNAVKKKWVVPTGQAFEDAFWQGADKASLVKDIEMWRPKSESFWGRMDDMSDAVPWGIDSHSKVRIYDGISDEYHWALITAQLSWRHDKEGGSSLEDPSFNVGKCEANISITRSYE